MNKFYKFIDRLEDDFVAILLGLMTLITFGQVVARYGFNSGWGSALEITQVLFAWLVLFGMSYGFKRGIHLGVDLLIRRFSKPMFKLFALIGAALCVLYGVMFLSSDLVGFTGKGGAYKYWEIMYRIGIGMESISLPEFIYGPDVNLPRWVAYAMLPVGLALLILRCVQAFFAILTGHRDMIIASHEAEELLEQNKNVVGD
ncbi:MAG: C4-dicarboxylate transporter DctQ subunit [Cellvibrionaceae bacterium]|jgi:C4-dicarboxylate transporter DctQ subunit